MKVYSCDFILNYAYFDKGLEGVFNTWSIRPIKTNRNIVLVSIMLAMFMAAIEGTIVATAIPSIVGDLGGFSLFSWVFSSFLLAQAVTIPIYGTVENLYLRLA
ncbi:hypothetical protein SBF1_5640002 [Candidatus Desulfosporosinus infrequens]|uniref:Major facilitator superfamily (MFS) profile domain-containing protein n=1 Tax=Candidatus Desulfosporosinus infrequens TaxID=2043169 RepID=A0A2U3LK33_9FIRM|nr:hypothetical protein SBF1_5640002 [Candidatus Desulfosporosinus infrequens]